MRVLVVGGTGFLGYHGTGELLRRGHDVTVVALPPTPVWSATSPTLSQRQGLCAPNRVVLADVNKLTDEELLTLLRGHEGVVYAAGADDRVLPRAPARDFFYHANVRACVRFFTLARRAGVKQGVILGSYFSHFDRIWPEQRLAQYHPYIMSRRQQAEESFRAALPDLQLCVLELPYIFGSMPGRVPLWRPLIEYIASPWPLLYPRGGTNCIAVEHVAEAIAGAVEQGRGGECYTIGDENLTWRELLGRIARILGKRKEVVTLPDFLVRAAAASVRLLHALQGREGGLDPVRFMAVQTADTFFDPGPSRAALGYGSGGLDEAIADTVAACRRL